MASSSVAFVDRPNGRLMATRLQVLDRRTFWHTYIACKRTEVTTGAPPTAMPVSMRVRSSCQNLVTHTVAMHGASPSRTQPSKSMTRFCLSIRYPTCRSKAVPVAADQDGRQCSMAGTSNIRPVWHVHCCVTETSCCWMLKIFKLARRLQFTRVVVANTWPTGLSEQAAAEVQPANGRMDTHDHSCRCANEEEASRHDAR